MNAKQKINILPLLTAALGTLACILRLCLSLWGTDEKGLLVSTHPVAILLWVVTAAAAILIIAGVRKLDGSARYSDNFGPSMVSAAGSIAMALGICLTILAARFDTQPLEIARNLVGALSILALTWAAICRRNGKPPFFLYHGIVCVYLTLLTVSRYQSWSSRPQLLNFFFPMMGCVLLALFAYQQTAFPVGLGKRRMQLATGMLGSFFCIGAMALGRDIPLYLLGSIWMLTGLCSLTPVARRRRNPITEPPKEE